MPKKEKISLTPVMRDIPQATIVRGIPEPERKPYTVTSEAGLFKNGKQIEKGETVELDEPTAERFKELGDIE